jgi:hypothetical protein
MAFGKRYYTSRATGAYIISEENDEEGRMRIPALMTNLEFVGQAEGDRLTYYVFKGPASYLVVSAGSRGGLNVNIVEAEVPGVILGRFGGAQVTSKLLGKAGRRPDLFGEGFGRLNSLYVMVALGKAKKLKKREGKAMVFKIAKR